MYANLKVTIEKNGEVREEYAASLVALDGAGLMIHTEDENGDHAGFVSIPLLAPGVTVRVEADF